MGAESAARDQAFLILASLLDALERSPTNVLVSDLRKAIDHYVATSREEGRRESLTWRPIETAPEIVRHMASAVISPPKPGELIVKVIHDGTGFYAIHFSFGNNPKPKYYVVIPDVHT